MLDNDFPGLGTELSVVVPDARGVTPTELRKYAAELSRVPDVSAVSAPTGTFSAGHRVGPPAAATGLANGSAFFTVSSTARCIHRPRTPSSTGCIRSPGRADAPC